jgi:hypothetical protein
MKIQPLDTMKMFVTKECILDASAVKQLSQAATDVLETLVLKWEQHLDTDKYFDHQGPVS